MTPSRREFLTQAGVVTLGFTALRERLLAAPATDRPLATGYGPLLPDPEGRLDLPDGFRYRIISTAGDEMDDGLLVPARADGMAAFGTAGGNTLIVCNHEVSPAPADEGAFGTRYERLDRATAARLYDAGTDGRPCLGGTTNILYDTRTGRVLEHRLSLGGTTRNCAGGPTPWGSWLTCEENVDRAGGRLAKAHGYVFEVPARMTDLPVRAEPLKALGRFNHEAVAVLPGKGIVYETEDRGDGLIYRVLPDEPGDLRAGGRLQAMAILGRPSIDTRNWDDDAPRMEQGGVAQVEWIDLEDIDPEDDDLRHRGFEAGAAKFARGEGVWYGRDSVFIACTNGGVARRGQIWRYHPSPLEGEPGEAEAPGQLELFIEATESGLIENADNITVSSWGDLFVCEDGSGEDFLVGVTPEAEEYHFARNRMSNGELCGVCFSPDASTMFLNMQVEGLTLAITGPWDRRA